MAVAAYIGPDQVQAQLGDMTVSSGISLDAAASDAAGEMNVRLGERYTVPLDLGAPELLPHHRQLVEMINARLAAGRLIMSMASPVEDRDLHRYGEYLVNLAMGDLELIMSGRVVLGGQGDSTVDPGLHDFTGPAVYNGDEESAIEMYVDAFYRGGVSTWWAPGRSEP